MLMCTNCSMIIFAVWCLVVAHPGLVFKGDTTLTLTPQQEKSKLMQEEMV